MEGLDMCVHASVCVIQSTTNVTFSRRDPLLFHLFDLGSPLLPSFAVPNSNNTTVYTQISHPALTCWHLPCTEVSGLRFLLGFLWKMASVGCGTSILQNEHNQWQV